MTKQESKLLNCLNSNSAYWQYGLNPAENQRKQPHGQAKQQADDTWIMLLWILGTIGFLILLAVKTI